MTRKNLFQNRNELIYNNGNYQVKLLNDGTKIRTNFFGDTFNPRLPETYDINISNFCENKCQYCYIDASLQGKHGNLNHPILNQIRPYSEIAINYAKHPDFEEFLGRMADLKIITNLTVNEIDIIKNPSYFKSLMDNNLIYGLGISITSIKGYEIGKTMGNNIVYHTIAGVTPSSLIKTLLENGSKVLILGYKTKGRGNSFTPNLDKTKKAIKDLMDFNNGVLSFDNLALEQLEIKKLLDSDTWESHYMGAEGQYSMYLDLVEEKFYKSSLENLGIEFSNKTLTEMFNVVRSL